MSSRSILAAAFLLDWAAGDPEWLPHPVRFIGKGIEEGERILRKHGQAPAAEFAAGGVLTFSVVVAAYLATAKAIAWAHKKDQRLGFVAEILLAWTCLASRSLHKEATAVVDAMEEGDNILARHRLARIVGRDTHTLGQDEISRAVIETVAESSSDGVVAPLFYMVVGGAPLAMSYKAINTLDSMIGHTNDRYFYFGKIAAHLDDVANLLPSRLAALGIVAAAAIEDASPAAALEIWSRDGMKHKSPNAGQPESAMAGALQVRLGGRNYYAGEPILSPFLGADFKLPDLQAARQAIRIIAVVSVLGAVAALLLQRGKR